MRVIIFASILAIHSFSALQATEIKVRDVQLIACPPVSLPDGKRVLQSYAPSTERCKNSSQSVLVYIAEFGDINALCAFRSDYGCTQFIDMTEWEHAQFEYMRGFVRVKETFRTCGIQGTDEQGRITWRIEMLTVNDDCKPNVNAVRHWDFMQGKVYIRDGDQTLGVIKLN